jgi:hypothetical protein
MAIRSLMSDVRDKDRPLPAAYAVFLPVLDQLSSPLRQLVHGQLAQFEQLLTSFDEVDLRAQGNFEGLGSLTTRGDMAYIVQTELLLRTEAPLEFVRRVAESEALYYEREYSDPGAKPVFRLMISIGPGILGHGRILALAAIFFMARIAAVRGAAFHWCFLPGAEEATWFDAVSVNTIKRFLRAASFAEASVDDVLAALQTWERLVPVAPTTATARHVDWIVSADDGLQAEQTLAAASKAARALAFRLLPPLTGEPRAAEIVIRRGGREVRRSIIEFPADAVCLSALNLPFAPVKQAAKSADRPVANVQPSGWEPRYLVMPHANAKVLRVANGVLILLFERGTELGASYFLPIDADAKLAGLRLRANNHLMVLLQTTRSGSDQLVLTSVDLAPKMKGVWAEQVQAHRTTAQHLFKRQPAYALPLLFEGAGPRFYSTHRREFGLRFDAEGHEQILQVPQNRPQILYANGVHRVVLDLTRDAPFLAVMRNNNTMVAAYPQHGEPLDPKRLLGMTYSGAQASLAYSTRPNVWTVPEREAHREFRVETYEAPLAGRVKDGDLDATVWSDARLGGEGVVKSTRFKDDGHKTQRSVLKSHRTLLKLGADAADIAELRLGDDGLWAVTVDSDGVPAELLCYTRRNDGPPRCARFALAKLAAKAIDIDPHRRSHG